MMGSTKYVPILKLKFGEVIAMAGLTSEQKQCILPVFEVIFSSPKKHALKKGRDAKLESIIDKFQNKKLPELPAWLNDARGQYPFILDFTSIFIEEVQAKTIESLLSSCASNQQNVIVSINLTDTDSYKELVYKLVKQYSFGLCIRVVRPDLEDVTKLNSALNLICARSALSLSQIDLLIDIKEEQDDHKYTQYFDAVQQLSSIQDWRNLIFANGSFPESMGGLKSGKEHDITRADWVRYNAAIVKENVTRIPIFADYSSRYPIYDVEAEKHSPSPTIKYTTESNWRLMKGGDYDYGNYFIYSRALIEMGPYYGEDHCAGDKFLKEKATMLEGYLKKRTAAGGKIKADGVGKTEDWIAMSVSHHTVVTLDQLSSRP